MRVSAFEDCLQTLRHYAIDPAQGSAIDVGGTAEVTLLARNRNSGKRPNPLLSVCPTLVLLDRGFNVGQLKTRTDLQVDFLVLESLADMKDRFDLVFCFDTLEHVSNPFLFCDHLLYITRPGGHVYVSTVFSYVYHPSPQDYFRYSPEGLRQCFADAANTHRGDATVLWAGWESDGSGTAALVRKGPCERDFGEYFIPRARTPLRIPRALHTARKRLRNYLTGAVARMRVR